MSDGTRSTDVSLARPARLRPSWYRRLVWPVLVAVLVVVAVGRNSDIAIFRSNHDCTESADEYQTALAVRKCQALFERTREPKDEMHLATALRSNGNIAEAKQRATSLLTTSERSNALKLLGEVARNQEQFAEAATYLTAARTLHQAENDAIGLARDDGSLATLYTDRGEFVDALRLLEECFDEAQQSSNTVVQCYCHTVAARTLILAGYFQAAQRQIDLARPLAMSKKAQIDVDYQQANLLQEKATPGMHRQAIQEFEHVLKGLEGTPNTRLTIQTELNLAYSYTEQSEFDDARRHLDSAALLDVDHVQEADRAWTAAQIAYRQHDLTQASSLNAKYFKLLESDEHGRDEDDGADDRLEVETLQARIELELGDLAQARAWAQRAVDRAERIRSAQSMIVLRPWVLAKRRASYELLFTALARSGQVEDAVMVFDQWQGRTVQDVLAGPRPSVASDFRGIAHQITERRTWGSNISTARFAKATDRDAVLKTMRSIDLLALVVADGDVWLLTANHGPPRLVKLAPLDDVKVQIDRFRGHADEVQPAADLGARLLPDDAFRATQSALYVIVDGRLEPLPVAALRHDGVPLMARRPIMRLLRLPEVPCAPPTPVGRATVIADPNRDLYNARIEAVQVASLLHTTSLTGAAATKAALFAAAGDAVLHLATHGTRGLEGTMQGLEGTMLALAGHEDVSAQEISAHRLATSLVVLSTCDSAASDEGDFELAGSPFAGFIAAGSLRVVATLRPVFDFGALAVSMHFYLAGGVADPARALAQAQAELASLGNRDWPYFAVFGPDICREEAPESP
jgi:tetratricopeptide (TPR) repeat protein